MRHYATQQRQKLLIFLREHRDRQFSVEEIADELSVHSEISISAVYRNINKLLMSGEVMRRAKDGSRKFMYQYVGHEDCHDHLHLKCESCGKIFHMNSQVTEDVLGLAAQSENFYIDRKKTVLYGSCNTCKKQI